MTDVNKINKHEACEALINSAEQRAKEFNANNVPNYPYLAGALTRFLRDAFEYMSEEDARKLVKLYIK